MNILLKYIMRAIKENKGRTFLLMLAIAVSGGMIYSMLTVKVNLEGIYREQLTFDKGQADISMTAKDSDEGKKEAISLDYDSILTDEVVYTQNIIDTTGIYVNSESRRKLIHITGIDLEEYLKGYNTTFVEKNDADKFEGDFIIISKKVADKYELKLGDIMKMQVGPEEHDLKVYGIVASTGLFLDESKQLQAIIPFASMSEWMYRDSIPNLVYIKMENKEDMADAIKELEKAYPDYTVKEAVEQSDIDSLIDEVSFPLIFSTLMGSIMCFFIIYSSFRVMLLEQLPQIGTFRSLGATKKKVSFIMLCESAILGAFGGLLGGVLGIGISYIIEKFSIPPELKDIVTVKVSVNCPYFIVCIIFSMLISVFATLVPVIKMSKWSVKNVVLNLIDTEKDIQLKKRIWFVPIFVMVFIIPYVIERSFVFLLIGAVLGIVLGITALIKLLPVFLKAISEVLRYPMRWIFGNVGDVAITNVATSSTFLNSTTLLVIGISVILMMNVISTGMTKILVDNVVEIQNYQLSVESAGLDEDKIKEALDVEGIKDTYLAYSIQNVEMPEHDAMITLIDGVSDESYFEFRQIDLEDKKLIDKLQEGKNVILTDTLKKRYGFKTGEKITLTIGEQDVDYNIIGFSSTYMTAGSFALISMDSLQEDTGDTKYNGIYIHTLPGVNDDDVVDEMQVIFENEVAIIETVKDFIESFKSVMDQITFMIKALSILAIFIGLIGIASNQFLTFIKRKRSTAIFRSVGMSKRQLICMLFVESIIVGIVGGIVGVLGGYMFITLVPLFFELGNYAVPLVLELKDCVIYALVSVVVVVCSNVLIAIKSYNFEIIPAIKVE